MIKTILRHGISFSVIGILLLTQGISAAEVQLKRFKAGDVIYAEDVNGNFQALADTVKQMQTLIAELQKQNAALLEKNRTLEANLSTLQAEIMLLKKQQYRLRSTPKIVPEADVQQVFGLDRNRRPLQYIVNDFEQKGDIVIDYATGRTWQQSGSPKELTYQAAQQYVQQLNQNHFAGYSDW